MIKYIKLDIPPEYEVKADDHKDKTVSLDKMLRHNLSGNLYGNKISIEYFNEDSNLYIFLNTYLHDNKLNKDEYDIYYKKGIEWYSNLYLYKKKD